MSDIICGGLSDVKEGDETTQQLVDMVKDSFVSDYNQNQEVSMFKLISYRTQVVAGTNYYAKVQIGDGEKSYVHLQIWKKLPCEGGDVLLTSVKVNKTLTDPIP